MALLASIAWTWYLESSTATRSQISCVFRCWILRVLICNVNRLHMQRIAHEKVESQRQQLEEQERQVALLRQRITVLEGGDEQDRRQTMGQRAGGSSVDDFSIKV